MLKALSNPKMEEHYALWLETTFALFGHKQVCLNRGFVWQYGEEGNNEGKRSDENEVDILTKALSSARIMDERNDTCTVASADVDMSRIERNH